MAWFLIVIVMIFLWVVSLCKTLYASRSSLKVSFLRNGEAVLHKKNVLLVIAHPDDESMFFSPTINYLTSRGHNLHILCLSTGNADAKGNIRKGELYQACAVLKVPLQQVNILDHSDLQDGFGKTWRHSLVSMITEEQIIACSIDVVITFDSYGVSGHNNHRDVHHGIRLLCEASQTNIEGWELISTSILRKYSGPMDVWLSLLFAMVYPREHVHCLLNEHPCKSFLAMAKHKSQWVWFRKLFVLFSSYSYVNTLRKINV